MDTHLLLSHEVWVVVRDAIYHVWAMMGELSMAN